EDGIRDRTVTGVQTCALPISNSHARGRIGREVEPRRAARQDAFELGADLVDVVRPGNRREDELAALGGFAGAREERETLHRPQEIGRASCRERGEVWRGDVAG